MPYSDFADPLGDLVSPAGHSESILGQPFSNIGVGLDWLSPTHIVNEFVKVTTGYDIFGDAAMAFTGDWEAVWTSAGAFRNLAGALRNIGVNVAQGNLELDGDWDGNAADAAYVSFTTLGSTLSEMHGPLVRLAAAYEEAAEGTYRLQEAVSGVLKDLMDSAMIGALGASVGTATIETGVGFVTGWGIAAYEAWKVTELTSRARKIIATAQALANGSMGLIQSAATDVDVLANRLPAPYEHPGTPK
jgi:hypothetical protein